MAGLRAAVSGLRFGRAHCDAYRNHPECDLVGLYDPNEERLNERAAEYPCATTYESFDRMLEEARPDLVSIAAPDFFHAEQSILALESGANVIVEKAMTNSLENIDAMLAAVERTGRSLYVGQETRLVPAFLDARRLLRAGILGTVYQAESCYIHNCEQLCTGDQWRGNRDFAVHGVLGGGCHPIDLLRSLLGEVAEVFAWETHENPDPTPLPDCITVMLRFDSGCVATVVVSIATRRLYLLKLIMNGTSGYYEGDNAGATWRVATAPPGGHGAKLSEITTRSSSHDVDAEVANLVDAALRGAPLVVDAWEGANTTSVCLAAIESARRGIPIVPRRYIRPATVAPPADPLERMEWRKVGGMALP